VFGGDSQLKVAPSGRLELCAQPNPNQNPNQQQVAVYGVKANAGPPQTFGRWMPAAADNDPGSPQQYTHPDRATDPDDRKEAQVSIPVGSSASLKFSFQAPALPPGSIVTRAVLEVAHYENYLNPVVPALSVDFPDGHGDRLPLPVPSCDPTRPCTGAAEYVVDVTTQFMHDPTLLSGLNATLTATAPNGAYDSVVNGIELDLEYSPAPAPGGYRAFTGCTQVTDGPVSSPVQLCPLLSASPGAAVYMQGTVYAPTGGVDIAVQPTDPNDPVRFNRGLIARTVVFRSLPGGGGGPKVVTAGGAFDRFVTLNASVKGQRRIATTVEFGDVRGHLDNQPPRVTYNSWDVK